MSGDEMGLYVEETYTDETRGFRSDPIEYETFADTKGELFRAYLKDGWRCESKVYLETSDDPDRAIGWFFNRKQKYKDCNETYLQGIWVIVMDEPTEVDIKKTRHYA